MSKIKTFIGFLESITTVENSHLLEGVKQAAKKEELMELLESWDNVTAEQKKLLAEKFDIKGDAFASKMAKKAVEQTKGKSEE